MNWLFRRFPQLRTIALCLPYTEFPFKVTEFEAKYWCVFLTPVRRVQLWWYGYQVRKCNEESGTYIVTKKGK